MSMNDTAKASETKIRVAINGLGRIGRATLKQLLDSPTIEVVAINEIVPPENLAYLLSFDSAYGRYGKKVEFGESSLIVEGSEIPVLKEKDPADLPWKDMDIDLVYECTGLFTEPNDLKKHEIAGAKRVILSAPVKGEGVPMIVHGANEPGSGTTAVSTASCTTNCIAPVVEVIGRRLGFKKAMMTTVHAYTSNQEVVDGPTKKMRRGRAAAINFVPTTTGAAKATTKVLPEFEGRFDGIAIRGPVAVGSVADITFVMKRDTSVDELRAIFREEAESEKWGGILGVTNAPYVSSDIIMDDRASVVDLEMIQVVDGDLVKVLAWYDNEWGYAAQMVREGLKLGESLKND